MEGLEGKVVVVTGGAGLLGREFCQGVSRSGGIAVIADKDPEAARKAASDLGTGGFSVEAVGMDITRKDSILAAIEAIVDRHGRIDALINSAYPRNPRYGRKFEEVTYEDFCENLDLHLGGYFLSSQQFGLRFKDQGGGRVVNIASIYGVIVPRFDIYEGAAFTMPVEYACIKSALIHLTRYMAKYFMGTGVAFNCVSPGGILDSQPETFLANYGRYCASKGMLDRRDITGTVLFLLSDQAAFVNGQNIVVDDGFSL